jgi:hypothetical protein
MNYLTDKQAQFRVPFSDRYRLLDVHLNETYALYFHVTSIHLIRGKAQ